MKKHPSKVKEIPIKFKDTPFFVKVDAHLYPMLSKSKWYRRGNPGQRYAYTIRNKKSVSMHRLIINAKPGEMVDHIDGDDTNNQRKNLRIVTSAQNRTNVRPRKNSISKYLGVSKHPNKNLKRPWMMVIWKHYKQQALKYYATEEEAALAYNEYATRLHGEYARLNIISPLKARKAKNVSR